MSQNTGELWTANGSQRRQGRKHDQSYGFLLQLKHLNLKETALLSRQELMKR